VASLEAEMTKRDVSLAIICACTKPFDWREARQADIELSQRLLKVAQDEKNRVATGLDVALEVRWKPPANDCWCCNAISAAECHSHPGHRFRCAIIDR
jgi:hypothetical protein